MIDNSLISSFVPEMELLMRFIKGHKTGRQAQTMAIPVCTLAHTSVFEYDGTQLPGM